MASYTMAATDMNFRSVPAGTTVLDCSRNLHLPNFQGLPEGVKAVIAKNCDSLTSVSGLPSTGAHLDCSGSRVAKLEGLPAGLLELVANQASLAPKALDGLATPYLKRLEVEGAKIRRFALPKSLEILNVKSTPFAQFKELPRGLRELDASRTEVRTLAGLPPGLVKLRINDCQLIENNFALLPRTLRTLCVDGKSYTSRFKTLDGLPEGLRFLSMQDSALTSLRGCPAGLRALAINNNQWLTSLEGIPRWPSALRAISCTGTPLDYIPLHALFAMALEVDLPTATLFRHKLHLVVNHFPDSVLQQ